MTERGRSALHRDAETLNIGPSSLAWEDGGLTVRFDEITAPLPTRLRGSVRLHPGPVSDQAFGLDEQGHHLWRPIMPRARVDVALTHPTLRWSGDGYFDTNCGAEPLEKAFTAWDWSRAHLKQDTLLAYDVDRREGPPLNLALRVSADGTMRAMEPQARLALPRTGWGLRRQVRHPGDEAPRLRRTLEDTPFYSRTALEGQADGEAAAIVHESLDLGRLCSPVVRLMLPFRMPRRGG